MVGTDGTHWLGIGGSGGAVNASFSSTPYAMCFTSGLIDHTQVVMNKIAGPTTSGTVGLVVATCPANTRLIGGGARITPASVGSLKPIASFPTFNDSAHAFGQKAAADGETNPDSWTAVGWNGGGGNSNNTTYASTSRHGEYARPGGYGHGSGGGAHGGGGSGGGGSDVRTGAFGPADRVLVAGGGGGAGNGGPLLGGGSGGCRRHLRHPDVAFPAYSHGSTRVSRARSGDPAVCCGALPCAARCGPASGTGPHGY
ncbi:hypothetical protein OG264_04415 [Streptomyces xanthophaeus]|uniref:hypothetical protein n=1 Tax=Streptomyces xanthophaeus TaxID=67385 RepID=UPI003867480A|nr:hypothetical protein OG264_04415 [Streptomyces xanthophaeus]WST64205.1 hypothetical protein OG605_33945 [Streptomyces xanthophaeus]